MYRFLSRVVRCLLLLTLLASSTALLAQDEAEAFVAVGSGIVDPVLAGLVEASKIPITINREITGTNTGLTRFCMGEADLTTATRPITIEESNLCRENEIVPFELVLGHNILALIGNLDDPFPACLTSEELTTAYAPSSAGEITNWNQVLAEGPELDLIILAPQDITVEYALLDSIVEGDGIRSDAQIIGDVSGVVATVSETSGSIGVVTLPQAQASSDQVSIFELDIADIQGCQAPSAEAVEDDLYPAADRLYVYAKAENLNNATFADFIDYIASDDTVAVLEDLGYTPVTDLTITANANAIEAALAGELPVAASAGSDFVISSATAGQVGIGGAAAGFNFAETTNTTFSSLAPNVTVDIQVSGMPDGFRRLCNGEIDFVFTTRDLTDDEAANCEANNITLLPYPVGTEAVVLVANAQADYLACLTTDNVTTIWNAASGETVTNWNQVNSDFPDQDMTLFSPNTGSPDTDLLLLAASGRSLPGRVDVELNNDARYRAAATANVEGALTFMNWFDYQDVLANNQSNIQLVSVDSGEGCVTPDVTTIEDHSYGLTRSLSLLANRDQFVNLGLQSWLWHAFSEDNFRTFEDNNFVGIRLTDLDTTRNALLNEFNEVLLEVNTPEATAEPEATVEATEEASE